MKQDEADQSAKVEGARQRRFWSVQEKRRLVAESFTPRASMSKVGQALWRQCQFVVHLQTSSGKERQAKAD